MTLDEAKTLKLHQPVHCPAYNGQQPFSASVTHISEQVFTDDNGARYLRITVETPDGRGSVWPSTLLTFA